MNEFQQHRQGCKYYFAPLDVCSCVERNMLDRIEALEARVAAADALAAALCAEEETAGQDVWAKLDACEVTDNALAAYHATKETDT